MWQVNWFLCVSCVHHFENAALSSRSLRMKTWSWGSWCGGTALVTTDPTENQMPFFFFYFSSFFPPGSHKHQRQTWVGSKCSLKKPTTLRNGRPNSNPWWRAKTKFGTRACIHFPGMACLRQLPLSNDSVSDGATVTNSWVLTRETQKQW